MVKFLEIKSSANACIALSSSKNAVSMSSARTTKRFPWRLRHIELLWILMLDRPFALRLRILAASCEDSLERVDHNGARANTPYARALFSKSTGDDVLGWQRRTRTANPRILLISAVLQ